MVRNRNISRPYARLQGGQIGRLQSESWCARGGLEGHAAAVPAATVRFATMPGLPCAGLDRHPSSPKGLFAAPCGVEAFT